MVEEKVNYLVLLYSLDSDTISIELVKRNIRITKLAMAQQFPNGIPRIKILIIPKIGPFPTGDDPAWLSRPSLHILLLSVPLLLLILVVILLLILMRPFLFSRARRRRLGTAAEA